MQFLIACRVVVLAIRITLGRVVVIAHPAFILDVQGLNQLGLAFNLGSGSEALHDSVTSLASH